MILPICFISEHMEDIVGLIFKYLFLLKEDGVHEWIFNEVTERFMVYILCKLFEEFWFCIQVLHWGIES